jgi:hypothetical protein
MRQQHYLTKSTPLAVAALIVCVMSARADVNMDLNGGGYYTSSVGLLSPDGVNLPVGNFDIGVYGFTVNSLDPSTAGLTGLTVNSTFNSCCLSPSGEVNFNTPYEFAYETLSGAAPGLNPGGYWSANGIQNAAYLWNTFGGSVAGGDQGAGLSLALLEVLYNGGLSYGTIDNSQTIYAPNFGSDAAAQGWYNYYINYYVMNAGSSGPLGEMANTQTYGVFVPEPDSGAGQEFIFLSPNGSPMPQQGGQPVPEPATLISAALLLLLPLGASALRIMRKKPSVP